MLKARQQHSIRLRWNRAYCEACVLAVCATLLAGCGGDNSNSRLAYDPYLAGEDFSTIKFSEVDLGSYGLTYRPEGRNISRVVTFQIFGVVPEEKVPEFKEKLTANQKRLRDKIRETALSGNVTNRTRSNDMLLKLDLVKTVRRVLQTDQIKEVVFTDFSVE